MQILNAFYFSGTGNTRYVVRRLCDKLSSRYSTFCCDITQENDFSSLLNSADVVLLAYPIYGSAPPIPMCTFVYRHAEELRGKEVIIVATQYMFSGDGAASLGRTVEKLGGKVNFAEHINMPNNLADCKMFAIKNGDELKPALEKAEKRMDDFASKILGGRPFRRGYGLVSHAVGYYCQRKLWRRGEGIRRSSLKIDAQKCVGCGLCAKRCPVSNIAVSGGKAKPLGNCVFCYRCINLCPKKAITLCGKCAPEKQYRGIDGSVK